MKSRHRSSTGCGIKHGRVGLNNVRLDGWFNGYASLFGEVDDSGDMVMPHAFKSSLNARPPKDIRMLFQHNPDEPIGIWNTLREDARGLYVEGQIIRDVQRCDEIFELMRTGAIDGLSIGFKTKQARKNSETGIRRILEVDLWEISVVTFPLLSSARVMSLKALQARETSPLSPIGEFEYRLMHGAGPPWREAGILFNNGYHAITKQAAADMKPFQSKIRRATQSFLTRKYNDTF